MKRALEVLPRHPGIYRVRRRTPEGKLVDPPNGARFLAIIESPSSGGKRVRTRRFFTTFAEAKDCKENAGTVKDAVRRALQKEASMTFRDLVGRWHEYKATHLEPSTLVRYRSYLTHFDCLMDLEVEDMTVSTIDSWIGEMKKPEYLASQHSTRCNFDHEFSVLRGILGFYVSRINRAYHLPFIKDHRAMLKVRETPAVNKDLTVLEFTSFIRALESHLMGTDYEVILYMALTQYTIFGRIQDAAALHVEDVDFERRTVQIRRKVQWQRAKGHKTRIVDGSKANGGKSLQLSELGAHALKSWMLKSGVRSGPLFTYKGQIVTYRQIVYRYDLALKTANLPFTGTHLIRHAAISEYYDTCRDILATARIAGHADLRATERYAKARDERVAEYQKQMDGKLQSIWRSS